LKWRAVTVPMAERRRLTIQIDPEHLRILKLLETDLVISVDDQIAIALDDYILWLKKMLRAEWRRRQAEKQNAAKKWTH
jgi:hypothetical protein